MNEYKKGMKFTVYAVNRWHCTRGPGVGGIGPAVMISPSWRYLPAKLPDDVSENPRERAELNPIACADVTSGGKSQRRERQMYPRTVSLLGFDEFEPLCQVSR